ncbi:tetratricopeptide repeat protein [Thermodesulfobacteriota bacterium]
MKQSSMLKIVIFLIAFTSLTLLTSMSFGQEGAAMTGGPGKSPLAEEFDKNAQKKLKGMAPEDVDKLDEKLTQALTFFYDREYARALPIFSEISDIVETMDVIFWYASCAAKAGESDLAIEKFKRMLDIDPNLHRARLELATVYYQMERYADARDELNTVLEAEPPESVKANIQKLLGSIEAKTKKVFINARLSMGIQRDSSVNSAPDERLIYLPSDGGLFGTGGTLTLGERQRALKDWVVVDSFVGNLLYDIGENKEWMWNTTGSFYQTHMLKYHEFGLSQYSITSGPLYVKPTSVLKLPFGYLSNIYEHDHLYDTISINPSYEYFFREDFSLRGRFSYTRDDYKSADKWQQENTNLVFEINPNFYFNNRKDILSFYLSDENLNARAKMYSYDAKSIAVSYYKLMEREMEFYIRFKYSSRDYLGSVPLWPYNREDRKSNLYAVLSKKFLKRYFASISYNYLKNSSNTALYDYDKHVYGINIGLKF